MVATAAFETVTASTVDTEFPRARLEVGPATPVSAPPPA